MINDKKPFFERIDEKKKTKCLVTMLPGIAIIFFIYLIIYSVKSGNIFLFLISTVCLVVSIYLTAFIYDLLYWPKTKGRGAA